jgi:hypothetical protein
MNIDPKIGAWFNFMFLIVTGIAAGAVALPGSNETLTTDIKAWAAFIAFLISCANLTFHLFSSTTPGPLASDKT